MDSGLWYVYFMSTSYKQPLTIGPGDEYPETAVCFYYTLLARLLTVVGRLWESTSAQFNLTCKFYLSTYYGVRLQRLTDTRVAPNVEFFCDDLEDEWNFETPFDFVYARYLTGSIKDWPRFFSQAYQ